MSAASVQSRLASLNINKSPLSPLKAPTLSPLVKQLLDRNNKEHDIYFGDSHFHNHFPHALLSQFALGAPESRLKKEWEIEDYLNPLPPKAPTELTDNNWTEYIGKDTFYHNYLDYFKQKIAADGTQKTVLNYALSETLLPSFVSGAVHPLIHTGFGLEFDSDIVVAEGLAEAAVHSPTFAPVVDIPLYSKPITGKKSLLQIVDEVYNDAVFNGVVQYTDGTKSQSVVQSQKASEAIKQYVMQWGFSDSQDGLSKAYSELFTLTSHFVASSAFAPPYIVNDPKYRDKKFRPLLDFFLVYPLYPS